MVKRGLFQSMPVTTVCGIIGALAISSFPWTSGFVSKSMISQAAGVAGSANASVFGSTGSDNSYLIDGMNTTDPAGQWNTQAMMPYDAVEEVQILKSAKPAEVEKMLGPTGNLRAPCIRVGKTILVGFNEEVFEEVLG